MFTFRDGLDVALTCAAVFALTRQFRKPAWFVGRLIARSMNASHTHLTTWGLSHVTIGAADTILDVGCGGGKTIGTMATVATQGRVFGVDYSAASVAVARRVNADAIASGRVAVQRGSVSALAFATGTFDLVTAIETHYYWPDLPNDLIELRRVLKPGGRVMLLAEAYRGNRVDWLFTPVMGALGAKYLTAEQHRRLLEDAGFAEVAVHEERGKGWLCMVGRKAPTTLP